MARTMASPLTASARLSSGSPPPSRPPPRSGTPSCPGSCPPGTPLREAALAAELGVSRSTVREAARLLGGEGLVRYQMNRGIVVAEITAADVRDIYAARATIETAGA